MSATGKVSAAGVKLGTVSTCGATEEGTLRCSWVTIPGTSLNITTSGGTLMITIDTYLTGGSHSTCRPIIDGAWAGSFGGLPNTGDPFWQEGLMYTAGGFWHPWHKSRLYPGVTAGNHTLAVQCATDGGTLTVGNSSIGSSAHFVELAP